MKIDILFELLEANMYQNIITSYCMAMASMFHKTHLFFFSLQYAHNLAKKIALSVTYKECKDHTIPHW